MLKLFTPGNKTKQRKDKMEIEYHSRFMNLFSDTRRTYTPCPKIHTYGTIDGIPFDKSHGKIQYVIMEALFPSIELDDYISSVCITNKPLPKAFTNLNLDAHDIVWQLLYIMYRMKTIGLSHCDLHTGNIMIVPAKDDSRILWKDNIVPAPVVLGTKYVVKVIDFGEGSMESCRMQRSLSKVLADLMKTCNMGRSGYATLLKERIKSPSGDPDINFLITILSIMHSSGLYTDLDKRTYKKLWNLSVRVADGSPTAMSEFVKLFAFF